MRFTRNDITPQLRHMLRTARDLTPIMREFGTYMIRSTDRNFIAQGRREDASNQWAPLSPATIARRRKAQRRGTKILQATGRLRQSTAMDPRPKSVAWGSSLPYSEDHHQKGIWGARRHVVRTVVVAAHSRRIGRGKRKNRRVTVHPHSRHEDFWVPARPIYVLQPSDRLRFNTIYTRHMLRRAQGV